MEQKPLDIGKKHDDIELSKLAQSISQADIAKVVDAAPAVEKEEINPKSTQHRYPVELVKIFKTLGMHAPTGIRPKGAAAYRAKVTAHKRMVHKANRGR